MINIQFDHQAFTMQRFGGISRYFANIQKHLKGNDSFSYDRGILFTNNYYLENEKIQLPNLYWKIKIKREKKIAKLNQQYSTYSLKNNKYDVFHPTYYNPYFLNVVKKPFVLTVHDMIYELFPEFFPNDDNIIYYKRLLIEKASHIIAVSESTLADLQRLYKVPDSKVSLIYHGYNATNHYLVPGTTALFENYMLYVGDRWIYKNFFRWLEAIAPLLLKYGINAVCAGGKAFTPSETEIINRLGITDRIFQIQANEAELANLYIIAILFAFPSLYEGFGFPILEAFNNNCLIAMSDTSCFREVGKDAAAYFNPYSIQSIQGVIENLLKESDAAKNSMRRAGQEQLNKFLMQDCMLKTLDIYCRVS